MELSMLPLRLEYRNAATAAEWAAVLAEFPLFEAISKRDLRKLVAQASFAEYGPGDIVVGRGDRSDSLFVVLGGSAAVRGKPDAATLRIGDYFGEIGALDGAPRTATVVAIEELHVLRLPRGAFLGLMQDQPAISQMMLGGLGSWIRRLEAQPAHT